MTLIEGIIGSIIGAGIVALIVTGYRNWFGQQISITHPCHQEPLTDEEDLGTMQAFAVRGSLKRLPKGHEIWLLTEDETTALLWPQGFFTAQYDPHLKTWNRED